MLSRRLQAATVAPLPMAVVPLLAILTQGCLNPDLYSRTTLEPEPLAQSRATLPVHDPFPRADIAPGESIRPRDFDVPRGPVRGARERAYGTQLRQSYGSNPAILP